MDTPDYVSDAERLRRLAGWIEYDLAIKQQKDDIPFFEPYPMVPVAPDLRRIADEIEAHRYSFDLRWKADMRAIERWQKAHPDLSQVWPDHADLVVWLLEQLDA